MHTKLLCRTGSIALLFFLFFSKTWSQTIVGGLIYSNTTWTLAGSPYIVQSQNIIVDAGITLSIEPGVTVKFAATRSMQIDGTLRAIGTVAQPIKFTSNASNPQSGDWGFILLNNTSASYNFSNGSGCILRNCTIEYAGGVNVANNAALRLDNARPFIDSCIIQFNNKQAIRAFNLDGNVFLNSCTIQNNTADSGMVFFQGIPTNRITVTNTTVINNTSTLPGTNIFKSGGLYVKNMRLSVKNCNISNNAGGGIILRDSASVFTDTIINSSVNNNGGYGILISYLTPLTSQKSAIIQSNTVSGNQKDGLYFLFYEYTVYQYCTFSLMNNSFTSNSGHGVLFGPLYQNGINASYSNFIFYANTITNNSLSGLSQSVNTNESSYSITYNSFSNNGTNGAELKRTGSNSSIVFSNNTANGNLWNGIEFAIAPSSNGTFNQNYFCDNGKNGAYHATSNANGNTTTFNKNIIKGNRKNGASFYYSWYAINSIFYFEENTITQNDSSGFRFEIAVSNVNAQPAQINISRNVLHNNGGFSGGGLNISSYQITPLNLNISQNIIGNNKVSFEGGGIYINLAKGNTVIHKNSILSNNAPNSSAIYFKGPSPVSVNSNTIVGNINTGLSPTRAVYMQTTNVAPNHQFRYNNILNSSANSPYYELWFAGANNDSLNARNCYWNTTDLGSIYNLIYDYIDSSILGRVYCSAFDTLPVDSAPVLPVSKFKKTDLGGGNVKLTWDRNKENDIAGYKIYWGNSTGYSFSNVLDAGNDTSYIFSSDSISVDDTIAVTAYDSSANGIYDQLEGQESWFSEAIINTVIPIPELLYMEGKEMNIFPNPSSNTFTIRSETGDRLKIFDVLGKEIKTVDFHKEAVFYNVRFNPGIYFVALYSNSHLLNIQRLVLVE